MGSDVYAQEAADSIKKMMWMGHDQSTVGRCMTCEMPFSRNVSIYTYDRILSGTQVY